jgi:hypothetical protein
MTDSKQDASDKEQLGHAYNWLDEHGQLNYAQLIELAQAGTLESTERLHELADDNNINYNETTDLVELAEEIYHAMETDGNAGVE